MNPFDLAPWDSLGYFQTVTETKITAASPGVQLCAANNRRIGLLIGGLASGGSAFISLAQNAVQSVGIPITTASPFIYFSVPQHGPLAMQAWYSASSTTTYMVYELIVSLWPQDGSDHLTAIDHPPVPFPTPAPIKQPGVNNDQGVLSYWRSLMQKIGGK